MQKMDEAGMVKKFKYEVFNTMTGDWLAMCVVGMLLDRFDFDLIQFQLGQIGILARVLKVVESFYLLSSLDREDRDLCVMWYFDMFGHCFKNVRLWDKLGLAKVNRT